MSALYAKLHLALVNLKADDIAASFPGYADKPPTLGRVLRVLGTPDGLARLTAVSWLGGLRDHLAVGEATPVPANALHRALRRVQVKSSPERLRRRQIKRHGITRDEALARVPQSAAKTLQLPFLVMASATTDQRFRLFLQLGPALPGRGEGCFNSYGLSGTAAIPWF